MAPVGKRKEVVMSDETQVLQHDEDAVEETEEQAQEAELDAVDQNEQAPGAITVQDAVDAEDQPTR